MHPIRFQLGLCPHSPLGAHSTPTDPQLDRRGPTSKGREGRGKREMGGEREREEGEREKWGF